MVRFVLYLHWSLGSIPNSPSLEESNGKFTCEKYSMAEIHVWLRGFQGAPHHVVPGSLGYADMGQAKYLPKVTTRKG